MIYCIFWYHHGGLFTPPTGTSSHIVDHPRPLLRAPSAGWHKRAMGGDSWCAHSCTRTDTRSEKYSANAGNDEICPLVNVPPNSFKWRSLSASGCTWHCQPTNKLCLLCCSLKILIPLHVYVYTCPLKCMVLHDAVCVTMYAGKCFSLWWPKIFLSEKPSGFFFSCINTYTYYIIYVIYSKKWHRRDAFKCNILVLILIKYLFITFKIMFPNWKS